MKKYLPYGTFSKNYCRFYKPLSKNKVPSYNDKIILGEKENGVSKHEDVANLFNNIANVFNSFSYGCLLALF